MNGGYGGRVVGEEIAKRLLVHAGWAKASGFDHLENNGAVVVIAPVASV